MMRTLIIPSAIVLVFLFGAATLMATAPVLQPSETKPIPVSVNVIDAVFQGVQLKVHSQGTAMPSTESQLIPEVSGRITWMSNNLVGGGYFKKGEELAKIDDLDYRNSRDRARAALGKTEAELEHAKFEYSRLRSLAERKLTSRSMLENALKSYRVSQAAFQDATVNFEQAEENLKRTTLRAPFSGIVRSESVDIGQFVSRGQPIGTLYANDVVEIRLPVADRQLAYLNLPASPNGSLQPNLQPKVTLTTQYAGRALSWEGRIVRTEAEIDVSSRMVQLVARVTNDQPLNPISVGLFLNAEIQGLAAKDVVVLPRSALRNDNQVLIVDANDKLRFRSITPLRLYQDDVLIASGLKAGERVCVSTLQTAIEGMSVIPVSVNLAGSSS
ncbi:MAG: efflux RND transporter periplasmic adaptor subunit [Pseudomonadales bacterium]|jgi:RND family efflux transporter MFP subunit|nr:efflux RND transporter periplasmic adaptor subunit [Pseudomonadales bacterium]